MESLLQTPIASFKGIGPTRAAAFEKAGIVTVDDAIHYLPRAYQNRGNIRTLDDKDIQNDGLPHAFSVVVSSEPKFNMIRRGMTLLKFRAFDETATVSITLFNQSFLKDSIHTGDNFRVYGKLEAKGSTLSITSPILEPMNGPELLPAIVPVYPLVKGLTQKLVSRVIQEALRVAEEAITEPYPAEWLREEQLASALFALQNIHLPAGENELAAARKRFTFDELFLIAAASLFDTQPLSRSQAQPLAKPDFTPFLSKLPYELTGAQKRSVEEICEDLSQATGMNRILTGDVGSGKTVVAAAAIYQALCAGKQAALMAPTEILARQHFHDLKPLFEALGYRTALLTGSLTAAQKKSVREALCEGSIDLVIGTHALLTKEVTFADLGLVITDEQHRFGVRQRAQLSEKQETAHVLFMTATPIPRTLTMITYGNLALSRIDEMPPGRQTVDTFVVDESYRPRLDAFIRKQAEAGHQTYIVCPSIEEQPKETLSNDPEEQADLSLFGLMEKNEQPPLKSAVPFAKELQQRLPDLRIGLVHGRMNAQQKDAEMRKFADGELDVLVSTTVIEVGVNVPSATLMIVENAERFGLSQLHQLRGRVGRGQDKSFCILVSEAKGENARSRLSTMKETNDGYKIAEKDLAIRGPGDFLLANGAIRQSGALNLPFAGACLDTQLIEHAQHRAKELLLEDRTLAEHSELRERLEMLLSLRPS